MKRNKKLIINIVLSLILLSGVFYAGFHFGQSKIPEIDKVFSLSNKKPQFETTADFNDFWKAWNLLSDKHINSKDITDQDKVWGAIEGLASSFGDPYTSFFKPEEDKEFREDIKGSFEGIGAEIGMKDNTLTIISPLRDTPAWNAGLKSGDKILKINGELANDVTIDKAISLIRGPKDTEVALTIFRDGEKQTREIKIKRGVINIPIIDTELREDGIFVISLYSFNENSDRLFRDALLEFTKAGSDKLILDLRGNPGGYLESAVNIASWFIDEGKVIVKEESDGKRKDKIYRSHGPRVFSDNLKFIVLIDEGSASASEILAGALREHKIAQLVGKKTFGKGSVQEFLKISNDTSVKITVSRWLTPEGHSISLNGLEPDVEVEFTLKDIEIKKDPQLEKAVEILLK